MGLARPCWQRNYAKHAGIAADSRDQVDRIHKKALELGGADEGKPGLRAEGGEGFYAAYFRDLDGNKLDVFSYG